MNFISMIRQEAEAMELKYCERCGGLWLRRPGQDGVDCGRCRARLAALLRTGRGRRDFKPRLAQNPLRIERLLAVAEMEVRP
jgi:hypothetical protein